MINLVGMEPLDTCITEVERSWDDKSCRRTVIMNKE